MKKQKNKKHLTKSPVDDVAFTVFGNYQKRNALVYALEN